MNSILQRIIVAALIVTVSGLVFRLLKKLSGLLKLILSLALIIGLLYLVSQVRGRLDLDWIAGLFGQISTYRLPIVTIGGLILLAELIPGFIGTLIGRLASAILALAISVITVGWISQWSLPDRGRGSDQENILRDCGNDICQSDESCVTCPHDCGFCYQPWKPTPTKILGMSCRLPRGGQISDGYGIYAFAHRSDNPSLCDTQLRMCDDGYLRGHFVMPYCVPRHEYITDTTPPPRPPRAADPLVQPIRSHRQGVYNAQGRLVPAAELAPITIPHQPYPEPSYADTSQAITKSDCTTPRGEIVEHGQFVTAYQSPEGDNSTPCESQLRTCTDGTLLGTYLHQECDVIDRFAEARARSSNVFYDPLPAGTRDILEGIELPSTIIHAP